MTKVHSSISDPDDRYGRMLKAYVPKVMDDYKMGGVYHDEFGGSSWAYTFAQWDNHSAVLEPRTKAVDATPGNLKLLSTVAVES